MSAPGAPPKPPLLSVERIVQLLPSSLAAWVDMHRPRLYRAEGGPLNGQVGRQRILRELARTFEFELVIETGTHRGATTEFLAAITGAPVATVELVARYRLFAEARLAGQQNIKVYSGDSRDFLRSMSLTRAHAVTLFYLDAHWGEDLPLAEELRIITGAWSRGVLVIDDFEVPDDPGYAFDDYGPGKALTAAYLPDDVRSWTLCYPALASSAETGARCGAAFLVSPTLAHIAAKIPSLRRAAPESPIPKGDP